MSRVPPLVGFLRIITGAGLLIGAGGILFNPAFFWYATPFLYAALIALGFEFKVEYRLKRERWLRWTGFLFVACCLVIFSFGIVLYPDKLQITAVSFEGQYENNTSQFGILWDEEMSDLRVDIYNPTNRDFDHLDLAINVGNLMSIRDQKQITSVPGVSLQPKAHVLHINLVDDSGKQVKEENKTIDHYGEVRVLCERLPKRMTIGLIFAVSALTPQAIEALGGSPPAEGIVAVRVKPPFRLWMRKRATNIVATGDYSRLIKPYEVDRKIVVTPQ
jgi:hypothetical protein